MSDFLRHILWLHHSSLFLLKTVVAKLQQGVSRCYRYIHQEMRSGYLYQLISANDLELPLKVIILVGNWKAVEGHSRENIVHLGCDVDYSETKLPVR